MELDEVKHGEIEIERTMDLRIRVFRSDIFKYEIKQVLIPDKVRRVGSSFLAPDFVCFCFAFLCSGVAGLARWLGSLV